MAFSDDPISSTVTCTPTPTRTEQDSLGNVEVPAEALYGAQTQRAVNNFPISGDGLPLAMLRSLVVIKRCAAHANGQLGELSEDIVNAIEEACDHLLALSPEQLQQHFPVDVFQTGSGTSSNMNANEVIATLASQKSSWSVHPNDHVNRGQSSNDVIPTAIQVSAVLNTAQKLLPAVVHLRQTIEQKAASLSELVKTGRTHLMDAMPLTFEQELGAWAAQLAGNEKRLVGAVEDLAELAIGGTAIGTGINAHQKFATTVVAALNQVTGLKFRPASNHFALIAGQEGSVAMSGALNTLAVTLMKISNDLRWMNSGPLNGLAEIILPAVQPGSSIMPGKVNPVIPEATAMVAAQVMGNHSTITVAAQSGNFQLNVMLPLIAKNLLESINLLSNALPILADQTIAGFTINQERIEENLARNPILVTALNSVIGYTAAAKIAKRAYQEKRAVLEVALDETELSRAQLEELLNPAKLT